MMDVNWERWARGAGVAFVVFAVVAFIVAGEAPTFGDTADEIVAYYDGERGQVLFSSFLFAIALGFWLWFASAVANNLRERGEGRVAATITAAAAAFVGVQLVATGVSAMLAHSIADEGDEGVVQALFALIWSLDVLAAVPAVVFFAAAGLGLMRTRMVPDWLSWAGIGVAALFVLRTTNWASEGFWSPSGGYLFILIPLTLLWILVASVLLVRATTEPVTPVERTPG